MQTAFFVAATILTLSMATAMAEPAQVRQQTQIASTHTEIRNSSETRNRSAFAATDDERTATGTDVIPGQPVDADPEPESINEGTEP